MLLSKKFGVDEKIDAESAKQWVSLKSDLQNVSDCKSARCIATTNDGVFCFDASKAAYANVIYLVQKGDVESKANLVLSKTRLSPISGMTIPRLELMAVVIGVRFIDFVKGQLNIPIDQMYLQSDSHCVLCWITTDLSVFVRVKSEYIKTADIAGRGCSLDSLIGNKLWWEGSPLAYVS